MLATGYSENVSRATPDFTVLRKPFDLDELRSGLSRLLTISYPSDAKPLS